MKLQSFQQLLLLSSAVEHFISVSSSPFSARGSSSVCWMTSCSSLLSLWSRRVRNVVRTSCNTRLRGGRQCQTYHVVPGRGGQEAHRHSQQSRRQEEAGCEVHVVDLRVGVVRQSDRRTSLTDFTMAGLSSNSIQSGSLKVKSSIILTRPTVRPYIRLQKAPSSFILGQAMARQ